MDLLNKPKHWIDGSFNPMVYLEDGAICLKFNSLNDLREFININTTNTDWGVFRNLKRAFCTTKKRTWDKVVDAIVMGFDDLTDKYLDQLNLPPLDSLANNGIAMGVEGCAYDMGAVVSGTPECCIAMDSPDVKETIDVYLDIGYPGETPISAIAHRGVAVCRFLSTLIAQGVVVNFHITRRADYHHQGKLYTFLDLPCETLTISQIAFLSSPEFFRLLCWHIEELFFNDNSCGGECRSGVNNEFITDVYKKNKGFVIPGGVL